MLRIALLVLLLGGLAGLPAAEAAKKKAVAPPARKGPAPEIPAELDEIVFATRQLGTDAHWYANFGYAAGDADEKMYGARGRLCKLNVRTGALKLLVDDPEGTVRDPQVDYDGRRILFSYRPAGTQYFHLYEINADGSGMRQLTDGPFDDIEPTYLPGGGIMLCSSRCRRWVNCWSTQVANLYTCDGEGRGLAPVSANIEQDNHPWPLPDGRVIYTRWEYVDRSRVGFHHLWTSNPDGTGQMVYYGNMVHGTLMIDAKPIPGTDKVVAIFSPAHGKKEHTGAVTVLSPKGGPDDPAGPRQVSQGEDYRDPYPINEQAFLAAQGASVVLMDAAGNTRELYRLPQELLKDKVECHEPRPIVARARERVIPPRVAVEQPTGRLILANANSGRNMAGVKPGTIKQLLVLETLPKPVNDSGKMPPVSFLGTYTMNRLLGTVPVEADGSAYFEVPALRSVFFIALDEKGDTVKRMQSFCTVLPGETMSCVGCHEQRTRTPANPGEGRLAALGRTPSRIEPLDGIPEVFDYPRDIQPILDRHCTECHGGARREGRVVLTGHHGPVYSLSYFTLTALLYVSEGHDRTATNLPPYAIGTAASPLMRMLDGSHYGAKLEAHEREMIRFWIESSAAYPGTYAALDNGMIGGYPHSKLDTTEQSWPEAVASKEAIDRRCAGCHGKDKPLPRSLSDDMGLILSNPDDSDPRIRWSRHLMFDLTRPEESLILKAPLAKEAGGYGLCGKAEKTGTVDALRLGQSPFSDTGDPDYQKLLALCVAGKKELERIKRFDMPGFVPPAHYVREMKRFGILPEAYDGKTPIDVYAADEAYWRSHWWKPENAAGGNEKRVAAQ